MEHIKVSDLATEFELKSSLVISELKKIGVWVPSADTPLDDDIANRIRRRLQLMAEVEQDEQARAEKAKEKKKKAASSKPRKVSRKTIKQLGKTRRAARVQREEPEVAELVSPLGGSMAPRKGKASYYKKRAEEAEQEPLVPEKVEVSIDDEPFIELVEAHVSAELLEEAMAKAPPVEEPPVAEPEVEEAEPEAEEAAPEEATVEAEVEATPAPEPEPVEGEEEPVVEVEEVAEVAEPVEQAALAEPALAEPAPAPAQKPRPKARLAPRPRKLKIIRRPDPKPVEPVKPAARPAAFSPAASAAKPKPRRGRTQERPSEVTLSETVTVKELSEKIGVKSKDVIRELMKRGIMATINQTLHQETAEELALAFDVVPTFVTFEQAVIHEEKAVDKPEDLVARAPVVTIMGHVDHGKTSLLDAIRKTNVAGGEAGGITQHIGAYHVDFKKQKIVFVDTPGHEAFTLMRARGAQVTDIVVLVVAADDGVMPQTKEAIDHARAAEVPIIVAINKIDKPDADSQRVRQGLTEHQLIAEEWGGDTIMVEVSALAGTNLDSLLEMILLQAEILELTANPDRSGAGVVLEAKLDKGRGSVASVLVQDGQLSVGDPFIAGTSLGKIRAMFDDRGKPVKKVGPSSAVEILGLQSLPMAGDPFQVVDDPSKARQIADFRLEQTKGRDGGASSRISLDDLYANLQSGDVKELGVVLKADTQGSAEVLAETLEKASTEKVKIKTIRKGVGAISESDVLLATTSSAIVIGFNVRPEINAANLADKEGIDVRLYTVIYDVAREIKDAMIGLLDPTFREAYQGRAEVRDMFKVPRYGVIAGSYVQDGSISRNSEVRLLRDNVVVWEGRIDSLRRFKEDTNEVKTGYECGISLAGFNDVKPGDIIEAFIKEEVAPELS